MPLNVNSNQRPSAGENLASSAGKEVVAGSGIRFEYRGVLALEVVPGVAHFFKLMSA
jgi:hypothetical protein